MGGYNAGMDQQGHRAQITMKGITEKLENLLRDNEEKTLDSTLEKLEKILEDLNKK